MANTDYTFYGILVNGSTGYFQYESSPGLSESVRSMQTKLNRLGYNCGTPNGLFGTTTDTQVRAFQAANGLTVDGKAGHNTLTKLNNLSPDTPTEYYGRERTHAEWIAGYSNPLISSIESLARTIYGEDTTNSDGQAALAKELYNRKNSARSFGLYAQTLPKDWKGIVFSPSQYAVATGSSLNTADARHPNQYSSQWVNCAALAQLLFDGNIPSSTLANQCFHGNKTSTYPPTSIVSTRIQIPATVGNKFYDYQTTL